ncbi:MAG: methyltransferase [Sulfuritalea sp.]|nr:methyltransferase [Sulfuritalea sp.]MDP1985407.1 methyltransferase [Sulfuritalea sp.]
MTVSLRQDGTEGMRPGYLCIEDFMRDLVGARALQSAFELGLIDDLSRQQTADFASLAARSRTDPRGLHLLLGILRANRVVEERDGRFELSVPFVMTLKYRDLLEAKLDFAALVAPDFLDMFTTLLIEPRRFFETARIFDLFSYDRCFESTPENVRMTRRWMRFTTALTKYEAQACIDHHDFSDCRRLLDVGGNSGEFALRICKAHPRVKATVLDLPVVCEIGMEHLRGEPEAERIAFVDAGRAGNAFPSGFDTACFKSMLHDWPDREVEQFLEGAYRSLDRGGTLLIFERGIFDTGLQPIPYSLIPIMLFFRSYRAPDDYLAQLERIGFRDIKVQVIQLEMPFLLITAVK